MVFLVVEPTGFECGGVGGYNQGRCVLCKFFIAAPAEIGCVRSCMLFFPADFGSVRCCSCHRHARWWLCPGASSFTSSAPRLNAARMAGLSLAATITLIVDIVIGGSDTMGILTTKDTVPIMPAKRKPPSKKGNGFFNTWAISMRLGSFHRRSRWNGWMTSIMAARSLLNPEGPGAIFARPTPSVFTRLKLPASARFRTGDRMSFDKRVTEFNIVPALGSIAEVPSSTSPRKLRWPFIRPGGFDIGLIFFNFWKFLSDGFKQVCYRLCGTPDTVKEWVSRFGVCFERGAMPAPSTTPCYAVFHQQIQFIEAVQDCLVLLLVITERFSKTDERQVRIRFDSVAHDRGKPMLSGKISLNVQHKKIPPQRGRDVHRVIRCTDHWKSANLQQFGCRGHFIFKHRGNIIGSEEGKVTKPTRAVAARRVLLK